MSEIDAAARVAEDRVLGELVLLARIHVDPVAAVVGDHVSLARSRAADRVAAAHREVRFPAERVAERDLARLVRADQVPLEHVVLQRSVLSVQSRHPRRSPEITLFRTVAFSTDDERARSEPFPSAAVPAALVPIMLFAIV